MKTPDEMNSATSHPATSHFYNNEFYKNVAVDQLSIDAILDVFLEFFSKVHQDKNCSAVDFGCGTGIWVKHLLSKGFQQVVGLDGNSADDRMLLFDPTYLIRCDLEKPIELTQKFDVAISIEVGEHLSSQAADGFVSSICKSADIVLFSAAHPGQGGVYHINEQPMSYWAEKFANQGFTPFVLFREKIWNDNRISPIYRSNCMLYVKKNSHAFNLISELYIQVDLNGLDVLHPVAAKRLIIKKVLPESLTRLLAKIATKNKVLLLVSRWLELRITKR